MSAFTRIADQTQTSRDVRKVPPADSCTAANTILYSITSSARASNVGGTLR
jgi:hypothetical protein